MSVITRAVSELLTAPAGTGKSYWCVYDLTEKYLLSPSRRVLTNLPLGRIPETHAFPPAHLAGCACEWCGGETPLGLAPVALVDPDDQTFIQRIDRYCVEQHGGEAGSYGSRVELIEPEVLEDWRNERNHPRVCWADRDLTGTLIILDECHNFASARQSAAWRRQWSEFCGELRHRGASILFVTQHRSKLAKEIEYEIGVRYSLLSEDEDCDPILHIPIYYWRQLRAKMTGSYRATFIRDTYLDRDGKKTKRDFRERIARQEKYFRLYDSFSAPEAGGTAAGKAELMPWQAKAWPAFLLWFLLSNGEKLVKPLVVVGVVVALFWVGPSNMFGAVIGRLQAAMVGTMGGDVEKPKQARVAPRSQGAAESAAARADAKYGPSILVTEPGTEKQLMQLVGLGRGFAAFAERGQTCIVKVGENIPQGFEYAGRKVVEIALADLRVVLDGGVTLRLSYARKVSNSGA